MLVVIYFLCLEGLCFWSFNRIILLKDIEGVKGMNRIRISHMGDVR